MHAVGFVLYDLVAKAWEAPAHVAAQAAEWIADAARPPSGARLVSDSDDNYTGLAFVNHNTVVLMLALREERTQHRAQDDMRDPPSSPFGSFPPAE